MVRGSFYQLVTATVVMVVLLAEMTALYGSLAGSKMLLQQERVMLQRALQAQRREREARLATGDAVAAMIAHEVKQPLSAMITRSETGLRCSIAPIPISIRRRRNSDKSRLTAIAREQ